MNKKKRKKNLWNSDYRRLANIILVRTLLIAVISLGILMLLYIVLLRGRISVLTVQLMQTILNLDYYDALIAYQRVFRDNAILFIGIAFTIIFFVVFRIYLSLFTKYFIEISNGINSLLDETSGEIELSPELNTLEKKLNEIKNSLQYRKMALQMEEKRKNDLVVYLAHDLKTPLTSVIGYLNLMHDEPSISQQLRERYLGIALDKSLRLEDLINEFFDITRFSLNHLELEASKVNLTRMLEQITYEFAPVMEEKKLTWNLQLEPDVNLLCDVDKLQRVFDNLIRNAIFYSYPNHPITIAMRTKPDTVMIVIQNAGKTIAPEKLERIFEQFYRLDSSRASNTGGVGLGLAISKEIVELHNGRIEAKSEDEKIQFQIILPLDCHKKV